jgi:hypothetical protein
LVPRNVVLGHRPAAVRPNSGEPAAGTVRARAEGDLWGPKVYWRPVAKQGEAVALVCAR